MAKSFYKIERGSYKHPKIVDLSDGAFRALIVLWDVAKDFGGVFSSEAQLKTALGFHFEFAQELRAARLLDGLSVHDWAEHQSDPPSVALQRERGSKGGKASAAARRRKYGNAIPANAKNQISPTLN